MTAFLVFEDILLQYVLLIDINMTDLRVQMGHCLICNICCIEKNAFNLSTEQDIYMGTYIFSRERADRLGENIEVAIVELSMSSSALHAIGGSKRQWLSLGSRCRCPFLRQQTE